MSTKKMKVLGVHAKDCYSVLNVNDEKWKNAWCEASPKTVFGRYNSPINLGDYIWLIFRCNCIWCDACLAIRGDFLTEGWLKK